MDPKLWKQLERIFAEAIELPESERADFLDRACGSNVEMRGEVESLIARAHGDGESLQRAVRGQRKQRMQTIGSSTKSVPGLATIGSNICSAAEEPVRFTSRTTQSFIVGSPSK